jgi:pilus assembly protein Flp/PilA
MMEMKWSETMVQRFLADVSGATAIEYALIAAGISVAIVASLGNIGTAVKNMWTSIASAL